MGYGKKIYQQALQELKKRREHAEATAKNNLMRFYSVCPEARILEEKRASTSARAARAVLLGKKARTALEELKAQNLTLQKDYQKLLYENGFSERAVKAQYLCKHCNDLGFQDGLMCDCLKALQKQFAYEQLSMNVPLGRSTFDTFSLEYYPESCREQMSRTFEFCKGYAEQFHMHSHSLIFKGGTGLGKTHLSLAIASHVIQKGFGVVYGSVQNFAVSLEKERFRSVDLEEKDTNTSLITCDLLIMDDLGTEFSSSYVNSALYNLINSRMLATKPTIISTNLTFQNLEERYGERFASRINGQYGKFEFVGQDIRNVKRRSNKRPNQ